MSPEEGRKFLESLLTQINAQDNRGTATPYYFTVEHEKFIRDPDGDITKYFNSDGEEIGCPSGEFTEERYKIEHEYTGFFFTETACREHIEANKHHYRNPCTYVGYCWRNPEMAQLLEAISAVTGVTLIKH